MPDDGEDMIYSEQVSLHASASQFNKDLNLARIDLVRQQCKVTNLASQLFDLEATLVGKSKTSRKRDADMRITSYEMWKTKRLAQKLEQEKKSLQQKKDSLRKWKDDNRMVVDTSNRLIQIIDQKSAENQDSQSKQAHSRIC